MTIKQIIILRLSLIALWYYISILLQILSKLTRYLINNHSLISCIIDKFCFKKQFPTKSKQYQTLAVTHAHYHNYILSLNISCHTYHWVLLCVCFCLLHTGNSYQDRAKLLLPASLPMSMPVFAHKESSDLVSNLVYYIN